MAEIKSPNTVWILGAGFSRSLGGPLIQDLLAHRDLPVLRTLFSAKNYAGIAEEQFKARLFRQFGQERRYWDHAEQFLDLVETAEMEEADAEAADPALRPAPSYGRSLLTSMLKETVRYPSTQIIEQGGGLERYQKEVPGPAYNFDSLGELASACRRALAVDCSAFLRAAQFDTERWSPYTSWATKLEPNHGVVTFNYDHVPELLASHHGSKLRVVLPTRPIGVELRDIYSAGQVPVLKVHGSVTWRADGAAGTVMKLDDPALGDPRTDDDWNAV